MSSSTTTGAPNIASDLPAATTLWSDDLLDQFQNFQQKNPNGYTDNPTRIAPTLVCLDLDGTLIDSVPDLARALNQMLETLGLSALPQSKIATFVGNGADKLVRRGLANGDEALAMQLDDEQVAEARAIFDLAYLSCLTRATGAYPGVDEFLQRCQQANLPLVLITNKPRLFTMPLLRSLHWQDYFSLVLCGDDLAEPKPSPMPIEHALEHHQLSPVNAIMIGDSASDFACAAAADVFSVAVTYGYNHGNQISATDGQLQTDALLSLLRKAA